MVRENILIGVKHKLEVKARSYSKKLLLHYLFLDHKFTLSASPWIDIERTSILSLVILNVFLPPLIIDRMPNKPLL